MFELEFVSGPRAGVVVPVGGTLVAGRDGGCDVEVPDPRVSRRHASFEWDGVALAIVDHRSSNGTFVNERPVSRSSLSDGDLVRMGSTRVRVRRCGADAAGATQVFGFGDAREPRTAHRVDITRLPSPERVDANALRRRLAAMLQVTQVLAGGRDLESLFDPVLAVLFAMLPQTHRAFLALGSTSDSLQPCAMRDREGHVGGPRRVSRSICRAALGQRSALLYHPGDDGALAAGHSVVDLEIRSALAVPLLVGDDVLGIVVAETRDAARAYRQEDLELAAAVGQQVAIAIRNAQLLREVASQTAMRTNLMRFLPEAMANQVLAGEIDAGLGGRRYRGTILFADLIGFTARAETMTPEALVTFMNRHFNVLVPCIERDGGSVDKFMGDAVLAVWGIPLDRGDATLRAVSAGMHMQAQLLALTDSDDRPLAMGVGITTGEVVSGNIGSTTRREYTVLGDPVNTAQRLGSAACRQQVLVGEATWQALARAGVGVCMPPLRLRNKSQPVQAYSVRGLRAEDDEVQLCVPVRSGDLQALLVRRLADRSFLILHQPGTLTDLSLDAVELPDLALGPPSRTVALPGEDGDSGLQRSLIVLDDPSLGGLIAGEARPCSRSWAEMSRSDTVVDG